MTGLFQDFLVAIKDKSGPIKYIKTAISIFDNTSVSLECDHKILHQYHTLLITIMSKECFNDIICLSLKSWFGKKKKKQQIMYMCIIDNGDNGNDNNYWNVPVTSEACARGWAQLLSFNGAWYSLNIGCWCPLLSGTVCL